MEKRGNLTERRDASHILGISVMQAALASSPGRPITSEESISDVMSVVNGMNNLRIKTQHGNRSTDQAAEREICDCFETRELLSKGATTKAVQINRAHRDSPCSAVGRVAARVGQMTTTNPDTGRKISIASLAEPVAPVTDRRSSDARKGLLTFNMDGTVDRRCAAVRAGHVIVTKSGHVDGRSSSARRGGVFSRPSVANTSPSVRNVSSSSTTASRTVTSSSCGSTSTAPSGGSQGKYVRGYTRANGTHVEGYYRKN
eukprot:TRINITY_DN8928_c0_g1_i1.p1 TRINITY_DN8928_c0_g1~~TRINITY_DN8928_c0_g1_i1.p1  ORF type:complete len:258 (-),score=16.19 TRINITY_DN8928_c0_g1_i1:59-832(-)